MEYNGKPLGVFTQSRKPDYGGYGDEDGMEQKHHADHAEADEREGADRL